MKKGWKVGLAARVGRHGDLLRAAGVKVHPCRINRGQFSLCSVLNDIATIFELTRLILKEKPTVVHFVGLKPVVFGWLATLVSRPPLSVNALTGMGYIFTSAQFHIRVIRVTIQWVLRQALKPDRARLIVQNQYDARDLVDGGVVDESKVAVIKGSGIDVQSLSPSPEKPGKVVAAYVGRMLRDKGVYELVKAARELRRRRVDIDIWLVGQPDPGNPTSIPASLLEEWTEKGFVKWLGYRDDIEEVWKDVHIAVLPSYREGMPLSLLEASAIGRPLVATNVQGCNELVSHGENGYVVEPQDWRNLANAIEELAVSPALRTQMGKAARKSVETVFDVETVTGQTLQLYETGLNNFGDVRNSNKAA